MAAQLSRIPDFRFSDFYYFDILKNLLQWVRTNVPEITDESDEEPFIQLLRAWALAHHHSNVMLDVVANETLLPTARLLESVRSQLKLIDFRLSQATPAQTEVILKFSALFTAASTLIVPRNSQFATEETEAVDPITFEAISDNNISRTDQLTYVYASKAVAITLSNKNVNLFDFVSTKVPAIGDMIYQDGNYALVTEVIDSDTLRINNSGAILNGHSKNGRPIYITGPQPILVLNGDWNQWVGTGIVRLRRIVNDRSQHNRIYLREDSRVKTIATVFKWRLHADKPRTHIEIRICAGLHPYLEFKWIGLGMVRRIFIN